jgi:biotin-(acetyl-CoA carboxylase) ligase
MFARTQNALRGRWENFWSSEQVCVVRLVGRNDVMDKLVYGTDDL